MVVKISEETAKKVPASGKHSVISLPESHTLPSPASRVHQAASVCAPSVGLDLSLATNILSLPLSQCWDDDLYPEPSNAKGTVRLSESIGANMVRARRVNEFSAVLEHSTWESTILRWRDTQFWLVWKQTCPSLFLVPKPTLFKYISPIEHPESLTFSTYYRLHVITL